jgi:hypothetical protein
VIAHHLAEPGEVWQRYADCAGDLRRTLCVDRDIGVVLGAERAPPILCDDPDILRD